jgi:tetratricopeptide (TPR) repeat protein
MVLVASLLALLAPLRGAGVDEVLAEARAAESRFEVARALELYREADRLRPDDAFTLQKIAQQISDLTLGAATEAEKKARAKEALAYAERAVALAPDNAVNVLSLAICHGKLATFSDKRGKVELSRRVKQAAERALALDPNYDWAHHVLGRWHHEVAELGRVARIFVSLVYGGLPDASHAEAVAYLERAVALAPTRVPHHVELGFAYEAAGRGAEAKKSFERALELPSVELYDEPAKERARAALRKA